MKDAEGAFRKQRGNNDRGAQTRPSVQGLLLAERPKQINLAEPKVNKLPK